MHDGDPRLHRQRAHQRHQLRLHRQRRQRGRPGPASSPPVNATPPACPAPRPVSPPRPATARSALTWTAPAATAAARSPATRVSASPGGGTLHDGDPRLHRQRAHQRDQPTPSPSAPPTRSAAGPPRARRVNATPLGVPGAPTGLTATPGNGQVGPRLDGARRTGGSPITGYTVSASPGGGSCTTATLGCTISGLTNGTSYAFTVIAANAAGSRARLEPARQRHPASACPAPRPVSPPRPATARSPSPGRRPPHRRQPDHGVPDLPGHLVRFGDACAATLEPRDIVRDSGTNRTMYFSQSRPSMPPVQASDRRKSRPAPATVPSVPSNLSAKVDASPGVRLTWTPPRHQRWIPGHRLPGSTARRPAARRPSW